jgi:hypothetical protein
LSSASIIPRGVRCQRACGRHVRCRGLRFVPKGAPWITRPKADRVRSDRLRVACVEGPERGRDWPNCCAAARAVGASQSHVVSSIEKGHACHGRQFRLMYPDGRIIQPDRLARHQPHETPVWVGRQRYPSIRAAERETGLWFQCIRRALKRSGYVNVEGEWLAVRRATEAGRPKAA